MWAADLLGQGWVPISSFFKVAKNDSASALSQHWPVRPTDSRNRAMRLRPHAVPSRLRTAWMRGAP
ncbi:hypothetical protein GCM10027072_79760 [Streptomyces bullii]